MSEDWDDEIELELEHLEEARRNKWAEEIRDKQSRTIARRHVSIVATMGLGFLLLSGVEIWRGIEASNREQSEKVWRDKVVLELERIGNVNLPKGDSENGNLTFPRPEK